MELKSIGKRPFYIMKCGHIPEKITGYVYATERNFYGIDKRNSYQWFITDIFTGALVGDAETRKEALAKISADLDDFLARAHSMDYCRKDMETLAELNGVKPESTEKPAKNTRRAIKTRTYNNFMRVLRAVMAKGYDKETAETITRGIFDKYEANPCGLSVWSLFDLVADAKTDETTADETTAETPAEAPQTDETTTTAETPTTTGNEAQRGAEAQNQTAAGEAPEKTPRTNEKPEAIQNNTRGNKSPLRGAEKPHRGKGRGRHSPRPKPPRPERVFGFQGEQAFSQVAVPQKIPEFYKGIPPGG